MKLKTLSWVEGLLMLLLALPAWSATITVTSREDSGAGSLRAAVAASNASVSVLDTIVFAVGNSITLYGTGPTINDPVIIDGGGTQVIGTNDSSYIFFINNNGSGTTIKNLALVKTGDGIVVGGNNNVIQGCRLGTDWADSAGQGCHEGVYLPGGVSGNLIGGSGAGQRNVISGNRNNGIASDGGYGLKIQGNYIGTKSDGVTALPNGNYGITLTNELGALIGGSSSAGEGNVVSGNTAGQALGISLAGPGAQGNTICGNVIGLTKNKNAALPNGTGIFLDQASHNTIGLPAAGKFNVIAGNINEGVVMQGGAKFNRVQNNYLGINEASTPFSNFRGVMLHVTADHNWVGGNLAAAALERNYVAGNLQEGIYVSSDSNTVSGNLIGTDTAGTAAVPNTIGVHVQGSGNCIGGANTGGASLYGNLISGQAVDNSHYGILLDLGYGNTLAGNFIGVNLSGAGALPNYYGVYLNGGQGTLVGGSPAACRNVISGNTLGIYLSTSAGNQVAGNYFGLNAAGDTVLNNTTGLLVNQATGNKIGGTLAGEGNYFCGSGGNGLIVSNFSSGNTVVGNYVGVRADTPVPVGDLAMGIYAGSDAHDNWIGEKSTGRGNCVAVGPTGGRVGIRLDGATVVHNALFGNTICGVSGSTTGIMLTAGGNASKAAPLITYAYMAAVMGSASPGDYVEVFKAEGPIGQHGGSLAFVGANTADAFGNWNVSASLIPPLNVCALATDLVNNTSPFSANLNVVGTAPTPSATPTTTVTPTMTVTATSSPTATPAQPRINLDGKTVLAFPNPGKGRIRFVMDLESAADITITLVNVAGERVAALHGRLAGPGAEMVWDASGVGAGIYLARILKDGKELAKLKVALIK